MKPPRLNGDHVMLVFAIVVTLLAYAAASNP